MSCLKHPVTPPSITVGSCQGKPLVPLSGPTVIVTTRMRFTTRTGAHDEFLLPCAAALPSPHHKSQHPPHSPAACHPATNIVFIRYPSAEEADSAVQRSRSLGGDYRCMADSRAVKSARHTSRYNRAYPGYYPVTLPRHGATGVGEGTGHICQCHVTSPFFFPASTAMPATARHTWRQEVIARLNSADDMRVYTMTRTKRRIRAHGGS